MGNRWGCGANRIASHWLRGGGGGIGRTRVSAFAARGCRGCCVAILDPNAGAIRTRRGERSLPPACDVADDRQVRRAVRAIVADPGPIDAIVNRAGIMREEHASARPSARRSIGSSTPIQSARSMFCRRQSRHCDGPRARSSLPRRHRRITSSARAHRPSPRPAIHAATKGAVESCAKALSVEPAPVGRAAKRGRSRLDADADSPLS